MWVPGPLQDPEVNSAFFRCLGSPVLITQVGLFSYSLPSPGNQRSPPSSQWDTLLYLEKLFSGSGIVAVPPRQSEAEDVTPCLISRV